MVALKPDTQVLLDGAVKVYKRGNSKLWQATFKIDQHWVRISTDKQDLEEAKTVARDQYLEYKFRSKHDLCLVARVCFCLIIPRLSVFAFVFYCGAERHSDAGFRTE